MRRPFAKASTRYSGFPATAGLVGTERVTPWKLLSQSEKYKFAESSVVTIDTAGGERKHSGNN
ncbi:hypothetical protein Adu01nite_91910 [Paractinoplanes durhamensis]|uniref:Uncharacterized protein n=1 Tax=Paractinoplanes durhamensis TaxID=113563 RepID=A0ABQ3ZDD4_9ACTN|nr:hypothetical protein Adu01nite_91910 [Actinoplanes durhamensis]